MFCKIFSLFIIDFPHLMYDLVHVSHPLMTGDTMADILKNYLIYAFLKLFH